MSKSLGNFYTVPDIVAKGHRPSALRYLLLSSHYRKQLNFTWAGMDQAEESIGRIMNCLTRLETVTGEGTHSRVDEAIATAQTGFTSALESDLNTAGALGAVFDFVRDVNAAIDAKEMSTAEAARVRDLFDAVRPGAGRGGAATRRGRAAAGAGGGDRAVDRGAQGRPRAPRLRRRRRHSRVARRSRHSAGGQPPGHAVEDGSRGPQVAAGQPRSCGPVCRRALE